jgi:hypothetical protein
VTVIVDPNDLRTSRDSWVGVGEGVGADAIEDSICEIDSATPAS